MKKAISLVTIIIGVIAIAVSAYFLARSVFTMQNIIALKDIYGDKYKLTVNIAVAQILCMVSTIACVLTIVTYFLFKNRIRTEKKVGSFLLKFEFPVAIIALIIDVTMYLIFAYVSIGTEFLIIATIIIFLFDLYPGLFFIINVTGAFASIKKVE